MYLALTAASGSPGVSTTALGLALQRRPPSYTMPSYTLLVEADPVGSSPTLAGFQRGAVVRDKGLENLINPQRFGDLRTSIGKEVFVLPGTAVSVLPGLKHAGQVEAMRSTWAPLAQQLLRYSVADPDQDSPPQTVIVDAGRMGHDAGPMDLMRQADLIGIVVRPTLARIAALKSALTPFKRDLTARRARACIGLIVIGSRLTVGTDTYSAREIARAVDLELITTLPDLPREARMLSDGASVPRWRPQRALYLRALHRAWNDIESFTTTHRPPWLDQQTPLDAVGTPTAPAMAGGARR
ncbi:hypothetical protein [Nocardia transvalensis]|uniref:hypothetical protein n=1 Tax=Nocardia transvalensis TaxID=37333 RepID=UPI001894FCF7|nr:hypothetical protein [Nocardia transvalensis]MBF6333629.1 hypothetical protein [Nocardia transvalensis]